MDDNIVEVSQGIFGEIQQTGGTSYSPAKNSGGYATKRLRINGEGKALRVPLLVLEHSLGLQLRPEYLGCHTCDVRNSINPNHLWSGSRLENYQDRLKKGRIKDVGSTSVPTDQKKQRGIEIIPGIRVKIQPNGGRICTLAKRSDGCAIIKGTKINGKTKSFYAHRLVRSHKLGRPVKPGYFACHSCDARGCINPDHWWEGTPADNSRDAKQKKRFPFVAGKISVRGYPQTRSGAGDSLSFR